MQTRPWVNATSKHLRSGLLRLCLTCLCAGGLCFGPVACDRNDQNNPSMPGTQSHAIDLQPMDVPAFDALLKQTKAKQQILVVDFWGTWCGPCVELFGPMHEALAPLADSGHVQVATVAWAFEEDLQEEKAFLKARREASQQNQPDAQHTPSRDYFLSFDADADADDLYARVSPRIAANPAFAVAYPMVFVIDPVTNQTLEFHGDDQPITPQAVVAATKRLLAKRGL